MRPRFFESQSQLRNWLEENHESATELLVGFYKKGSGKESITYQQVLDEALAFGWIDGVRRSIDEERWTIRLTPRRRGSIWSAANIARVGVLTKLGAMHPSGIRAFESRDPEKTNRYSFERADAALDAEQEKRFRANRKAWTFWESQPPSYRKPAAWWVVSAKKEETRARRLDRLIADSAAGVRIDPMKKPGKAGARPPRSRG
jgi:uncharacterized protein YdeI (YjbR/CyaY-like superfamily)